MAAAERIERVRGGGDLRSFGGGEEMPARCRRAQIRPMSTPGACLMSGYAFGQPDLQAGFRRSDWRSAIRPGATSGVGRTGLTFTTAPRRAA